MVEGAILLRINCKRGFLGALVQAMARLAAVQAGDAPKEALAAQAYAVPALVATLLGRHPQPQAGAPLPPELATHASYLLRRWALPLVHLGVGHPLSGSFKDCCMPPALH